MKWTKENVFEEAMKYKTITEFQKGSPNASRIAYKNNWLSEMTWLERTHKTNGYWNVKENVFVEAKKYKTRSEFKKFNRTAYQSACKNGWIVEMDWFFAKRYPRNYWSKERIFEKAKECETKKEFLEKYNGAYQKAVEYGWIDEMDWFVDGRVKLFTEKIDCVYKYYFKETNSVYIGRTIDKQKRDWEHRAKEKDTLYKYAKENGLEVPQMEIIEDGLTIEEGQKREGYWINFYKNTDYIVLNKTKAGSIGRLAFGKWNKESVFAEAKKYKTRYEFFKFANGAWCVANKNGWLDELFPKAKCAA